MAAAGGASGEAATASQRARSHVGTLARGLHERLGQARAELAHHERGELVARHVRVAAAHEHRAPHDELGHLLEGHAVVEALQVAQVALRETCVAALHVCD